MSAGRTTIRGAVLAALFGNVPEVGQRVFAARSTPLSMDDLPAILIQTPSGSDNKIGDAPLLIERTVNMMVQIVVKSDDGAADLLDTISAKVDALMYVDETFGGRIQSCTPVGYAITLQPDGESEMAGISTEYAVIYRETLPEESTGGVPFLGVDSDADMNGGGAAENSISTELEQP